MTPGSIFLVFVWLGCRGFGGPTAHMAMFRTEFVQRRAWLGEADYAALISICQFLPGPTSSQVSMLLGWRQAGLGGLIAAWLGFLLPSALVMVVAGICLSATGVANAATWITGMKLAVLAIVAAAIITMAKQWCPSIRHGAIAMTAAVAALITPVTWLQLPILFGCGLAGLALLQPRPDAVQADHGRLPSTHMATACAALLVAGLTILPLCAVDDVLGWWRTASDVFRAGSLVFGGGHVVLPLLQSDLVVSGRIPSDVFLAGYGLAQVVPGPMFSLAGYLGAVMHGPEVWPAIGGALLALLCLFLPGGLCVLAILPIYARVRAQPAAGQIIDGLCAGVVGLLLAACYDPVMTSSVHGTSDAALACAAFLALVWLRVPVWAVVLVCAAITAALAWC